MSKVVEFEYIRLKPADNGYILEFTKITEKPGSMDSRNHVDHHLVYSDDQLDDAMAKMKELFMFNKTVKGNADISSPSTEGSILGPSL